MRAGGTKAELTVGIVAPSVNLTALRKRHAVLRACHNCDDIRKNAAAGGADYLNCAVLIYICRAALTELTCIVKTPSPNCAVSVKRECVIIARRYSYDIIKEFCLALLYLNRIIDILVIAVRGAGCSVTNLTV